MLRSCGTLSLAALLALCGCDFFAQATARTAAVATILNTPPTTLVPGAVALRDGGLPFDAGVLGDAGVSLPPVVAVAFFLGQLQGEGLSLEPVALGGAAVTVGRKDAGAPLSLEELSPGSYALPLTATLAYVDNATYEFTAVHQGQTYVSEVAQVPPPERIQEFHPPAGFIDLPALSPFTFSRPSPGAGQERFLGFVSVFALEGGSKAPVPTFTNVPATPLDFLKLVVASGEWKQGSVTLPATAFPLPNQNYVIVLTSVKLGGPTSLNLFAGSAVLAGTADVGIVKTR